MWLGYAWRTLATVNMEYQPKKGQAHNEPLMLRIVY
jgi:hypothetical protein